MYNAEAQAKYAKKCLKMAVKYTPNEADEMERVSYYLLTSGKTANSFIKEAIKEYLDRRGV